jgi:hypothetical protein
MAAGFVLGEQSRAQQRTNAQERQPQPQQPQPQLPPSSAAPEPRPARSGPYCPQETRATAVDLGLPSDLRQIFKIQTDNGTTVWICEDPNGGMYYQSRTGGQKVKLVQGRNGLFLTGVREQGERDYWATADNGNEFLVDGNRLEVRFANGTVQQNEVVESQ